MIDIEVLRQDADRVRASQLARGSDPTAVDSALGADLVRRQRIQEFEQVRAQQKALGRTIAGASEEAKPGLLAEARDLATAVVEANAAMVEAEALARTALRLIPNLVHTDVPHGGEEKFNLVSLNGVKPVFNFQPKDHVELGKALGAIDVERGVKVSGSRFYFLTGVGAQLEFALINMAMDQARQAGFIQIAAPALVRRAAMEGTGFLDQVEDGVYQIEGEDLFLVGTSEVPMAAYHGGETLVPDSLPLRYAAFSPCYRKEAGSAGKDEKGIFRVHWFDKVEMFVYTTTDQAETEHARLLRWEQDFLDKLELHYRVIDVAAGDLGPSAVRKFDCEAWLPSQERFRELTSTSNCTDFQTRRLNTKVQGEFAATLNGTLCAVTRTIVALLETHQQQDGSVRVPRALQPYMGGLEVMEPV